MHTRFSFVVLAALVAMGIAGASEAAEIKEKEPGPRATGKLYQWKSKAGIVYHYRIPKKYDPEKGANLTFVLHGSNLDHRWGFANHSKDTFRPDDIVVSPDGTTSNGRGGFNSLGQPADAKRFKAFHEELKELLNVRRTYLYGHSQGSFFAFYYAGAYPELVDGVVGHASGVWTQTQLGKKGHHQAIVLMHGTQDPVVPYGQSVGGYDVYCERKYPMVRLRSLEGWNHWPAEHNGPVPHTSQQLAWVEGMTTDDMERLEACLDVLATNKNKERHDYAALFALSERIVGLEGAPEALVQRARKAMDAVEALATQHVEAIGPPEKAELDGKAWIGHLPVFLRSFQGVPACEAFREQWQKVLDKHEKDGGKHLKKYWPARNKGDAADAFKAGAKALEKAFLWFPVWDRQFRDNLAAWRKDAKKNGLQKGDYKVYDAIVKDFEKGLTDGYKAFDKLNRKVGSL